MSDTFHVITTLCYGVDNGIVNELQAHVAQSIIYDPSEGAWVLGEWTEEGK